MDKSNPTLLNRREFLAAGTAAAISMTRASFADSAASSSREPLRQMEYGQVVLTEGPIAEQYQAVHEHYLSLSNDRLLKVYRQAAGMPAPGPDMGGWYDYNGFVPGHSLGQYISGLARIGASTGDAGCHEKVNALVEGFARTLGSRGESILRPQTNLWVCYTLDKHFAGLIDAATLSRVQSAIPLLSRVLEGATPLLPAQGRDRIGKKEPPYDETFVMPENLFAAHMLTGNAAFEQLGLRYMLNRELFDPLASGSDPFPGQHAYSHAIALSSAGMAYLRYGDSRYRAAMHNAFTLLTTQQQFASGGWGPNETFVHPHQGELYASLSSTPDHFETPCGSYAAIKLARYLLRTAPNLTSTAYGDYLERVLYNTILAVRRPDSDGDYPYYSTYSSNAVKTWYKAKWPCCSGTLVQTVADYPLNVYLHAPGEGIYVNLYTPSELRITVQGTPITLRQTTRYPAEDTVEFTVESSFPVAVPLYLRIPAWSAGPATLAWNGVPFASAAAGTWHRVAHRWKAGDRLRLSIPQDFRLEPIDDRHPDVVAVMRGPLQYVALQPSSAGTEPTAPQDLVRSGPLLFSSPRQATAYVPLFRVGAERYTSYFSRA